MNNPRKLVPEGRLQRKALASEFYISKFRQVLMRHGLTMSIILFFCILIPKYTITNKIRLNAIHMDHQTK